MTHRITVSVDVAARDDRQAAEWARKLDELLKNPVVRIAMEGAGIVVETQQVYEPQRVGPPRPPARR